MAQQNTRQVDVTRSYIPIDPNSFPENLLISNAREGEQASVMVYDGKNFLPTAYGYKSYFGIDTEHPADALAARVDAVIIFQNNALNNIMIALCDSGIWYKAGASVGAWTQLVALPDNVGTELHYPWTWCTLNDNLYLYRSNNASVYRIYSQVAAPGFALETIVPSFLNMAAQIGIFRAGNRLGFWDSANSVAWSGLDDFSDFTPDLRTLAGSSIFAAVVGRIINIKSHGDGFMIYATKSIVFVAKAAESLFLWDPKTVLEKTGIAYMEEVVEALPNTTHFAFTTTGIYKIDNARAEIIVPDVKDFLGLYDGPKYIKYMAGRYLFFESIDPSFQTAFPIVTDYPVPPITITITAETFEAFFAQTQGVSPEVSMQDFLNAMQLGVFMDLDAAP